MFSAGTRPVSRSARASISRSAAASRRVRVGVVRVGVDQQYPPRRARPDGGWPGPPREHRPDRHPGERPLDAEEVLPVVHQLPGQLEVVGGDGQRAVALPDEALHGVRDEQAVHQLAHPDQALGRALRDRARPRWPRAAGCAGWRSSGSAATPSTTARTPWIAAAAISSAMPRKPDWSSGRSRTAACRFDSCSDSKLGRRSNTRYSTADPAAARSALARSAWDRDQEQLGLAVASLVDPPHGVPGRGRSGRCALQAGGPRWPPELPVGQQQTLLVHRRRARADGDGHRVESTGRGVGRGLSCRAQTVGPGPRSCGGQRGPGRGSRGHGVPHAGEPQLVGGAVLAQPAEPWPPGRCAAGAAR